MTYPMLSSVQAGYSTQLPGVGGVIGAGLSDIAKQIVEQQQNMARQKAIQAQQEHANAQLAINQHLADLQSQEFQYKKDLLDKTNADTAAIGAGLQSMLPSSGFRMQGSLPVPTDFKGQDVGTVASRLDPRQVPGFLEAAKPIQAQQEKDRLRNEQNAAVDQLMAVLPDALKPYANVMKANGATAPEIVALMREANGNPDAAKALLTTLYTHRQATNGQLAAGMKVPLPEGVDPNGMAPAPAAANNVIVRDFADATTGQANFGGFDKRTGKPIWDAQSNGMTGKMTIDQRRAAVSLKPATSAANKLENLLAAKDASGKPILSADGTPQFASMDIAKIGLIKKLFERSHQSIASFFSDQGLKRFLNNPRDKAIAANAFQMAYQLASSRGRTNEQITIDDVVKYLLDPSMIRLDLSEIQGQSGLRPASGANDVPSPAVPGSAAPNPHRAWAEQYLKEHQ